jgi:hypothetical protein
MAAAATVTEGVLTRPTTRRYVGRGLDLDLARLKDDCDEGPDHAYEACNQPEQY